MINSSEHNKAIFSKFSAPIEEVSAKKIEGLINKYRTDTKPKKVLDVGCNDGSWSAIFPKDDYTGIDIAESVHEGIKKGLNLIQHDLTKGLPFEDNQFDIILAREIIEHMLDVESFARELCRVLKPGGSLVVTTPNVASLHYRIRLLFGQTPTTISAIHPDGWPGNGHVHVFSVKDLETLLKNAGLKPQKSIGKFLFLIPGIHEQTPVLNKVCSALATHLPTLSNNIITLSTK